MRLYISDLPKNLTCHVVPAACETASCQNQSFSFPEFGHHYGHTALEAAAPNGGVELSPNHTLRFFNIFFCFPFPFTNGRNPNERPDLRMLKKKAINFILI